MIDEAHRLGIVVLMDIVHRWAVRGGIGLGDDGQREERDDRILRGHQRQGQQPQSA